VFSNENIRFETESIEVRKGGKFIIGSRNNPVP